MGSVIEGVRPSYQKDVTFNNVLPYLVKRNSEVGQVISSLCEKEDLSAVSVDALGVFSAKVSSFIKNGCGPFESFIRAFYDECSMVYIPAKFTSMENIAWSFADNAWFYDKWLWGDCELGGASKHEYRLSMNILAKEWNSHSSHWEDVFMAFWKLVE